MNRDELEKIYLAAEQGDAEALYKLGTMFKDGTFESIAPIYAKHFAKSAMLGYYPAKKEVLKIYKSNPSSLFGLVDKSEILKMFDNEQNIDSESSMLLVELFPNDMKSGAVGLDAEKLINDAAEKGNPEAACKIAFDILYKADDGTARDYDKAYELLRVAEDAGIPQSYFCLANLYMNGLGVPKDTSKAFSYLRKASECGIDAASSLVANMYFYGSESVRIDYKLAAGRYEAIVNKNKFVYMQLSKAYSHVKGDYLAVNKAIENAKKANTPAAADSAINLAEVAIRTERYDEIIPAIKPFADAGDNNAEYIMGFIYANGLGVKESTSTAKEWLTKSQSHGNALAASLLADI